MTMARQVATVTVATVGLGLNLKAWMLLGPRLAQRTDVGLREYVLLMGVPLAVAAVARIPAGVAPPRGGGAGGVFPGGPGAPPAGGGAGLSRPGPGALVARRGAPGA